MPLKMYLHSVQSDIVGSCQRKHENKKVDNLSPQERDAINVLKSAQFQGHITIKEVDKGGGICVMNKDDYIAEMDSQLTAVFENPDGTQSQFYALVTEDSLSKKKTEILSLIKNGVENKIISESDAKIMQPNGKPGKLYGIPKLHKGIPEGKRLPPCRPIVSNSGSNTEYISAFIDIHSKRLVGLICGGYTRFTQNFPT